MDENEKRKLFPDLLKECMKAHEELSRSGKLHTALPPLESFTQDRQKLSQTFLQECLKVHDNLRKEGDTMSLKEIFQDTIAIAEGLEYGEISFTYDKLASAMKMGHPAEFIMEALDELYLKVRDDIPPTKKEVDILMKSLKRIKRNFKIKELSQPIKKIAAYQDRMNEDT